MRLCIITKKAIKHILWNLLYDLRMTGPVQHHNGNVINVALQRFGYLPQVLFHRRIDIDAAFGTGAYRNLFHIYVRRVEQTAFGGNSDDRDGTRLSFGYQVCSFNRVDGNIHFIAAGADKPALYCKVEPKTEEVQDA